MCELLITTAFRWQHVVQNRKGALSGGNEGKKIFEDGTKNS
jgi:hypothetical protein